MVLSVDTLQNPQKVLSNFLSFFWDFGHIWMLLEISRTFSRGAVKLLFFQSRAKDALSIGKKRQFFQYVEKKKKYLRHYFWYALSK